MKKRLIGFLIFCFGITLFAQERPIVYDIQTIVLSGTKINIYWKLPEDYSQIKKLSVFRSNTPIVSIQQIEKMTPIVELPSSSTNFIDNVDSYNEYFYAVIAYTSKYYDLIMPSVNATVKGTRLVESKTNTVVEQQLKEKVYTEGELRETPLPLLNLIEEPYFSDEISDSVINVATPIANKSNKKVQKEISPYFFEVDLISPDGGDDFLLFNILKEEFIQENYQKSIVSLNKLIGTNVSESVLNRAYFYLGEAKFFLGDYEGAVKAFVKIASVFPDLSKLWINRSLDRISLPQ